MLEDSVKRQMQRDVATALRTIAALEAAYEAITIGQLVSLRARTHSSTTAIDVFERGQRATYDQADRWSNKCAHALRAFGLRKGDRIGVMLPNRIEFPILWFGLAKLGAVLIPINMHYTSREIEYVLSDTQAKVAVVDESAWKVFSAMNPWPKDLAQEHLIFVGDSSARSPTTLDGLLKGMADTPVEEDVRPDDLLNVAYTSGTTGSPKGCMLTHDYWGVGSYAAVNGDFLPYKRYLSMLPFFYGYSQGMLLKSYRQGGTLYLAEKPNSAQIISWIERYNIESCSLTAQTVRQYSPRTSTCLKQVTQLGTWSAHTLLEFRERFGVRCSDSYSMTEVGYCTQMPNIPEMEDSGSVGIRSPFRELRLVDKGGRPTPVGEVGELWVRGRAIFQGYWGRPQLNASAFEGQWFKTSDLLRCDEFGFHWFVGRKNDIIQGAGHESISAREVEAVIREIPEIAEVAAVPVGDRNRGQEVKIYVELKEGLKPPDLAVETILMHARARLAPFKVPRYIAFTPALPRTASSNKVAKRELLDIADPIAGAYDAEQKCWR